MNLLGRNFAYLLTVTLGLIGGTMAASIPIGVTMRDLRPRLLETPPSDPICYPGYNNMPTMWNSSDFQPVIRDFQALIEDNLDIYIGFTQMFEQIPNSTRYQNDYNGIGPLIRDYEHMLYRLNRSLEWSPMYGEADLFTAPITTLLLWPSCTAAGYQMLTDDRVNEQFRRHLNVWADFLSTPRSRCALTDVEGGWFSGSGLEAQEKAGGKPFGDLYKCNPTAPYYGFDSWDHFFTREFKNITSDRPVDAPNGTTVITNPCESTPYNITHDVKEHDIFWIKGEPYSLSNMLHNDPLTNQFIGGTAYQSYLAPVDYHRWHSPVNGTIVKIVKVPGTYYAVSKAFAFSTEDPNPDPGMNGDWSQKYMSNVATRMLMFIDADNQDIGLMVFIAVGMGEISSCEATVQEQQHVEKGEQLGMFHIGGSSFVLVFRDGVEIKFENDPIPMNAPRVKLNKRIGQVRK